MPAPVARGPTWLPGRRESPISRLSGELQEPCTLQFDPSREVRPMPEAQSLWLGSRLVRASRWAHLAGASQEQPMHSTVWPALGASAERLGSFPLGHCAFTAPPAGRPEGGAFLSSLYSLFKI